MTCKVLHNFCVILVIMEITIAVGKDSGLEVQPPLYHASSRVRFTCEGLQGASHALSRTSWIFVTADGEKQINCNSPNACPVRNGSKIDLFMKPEYDGAAFTCRAHARSPPHRVLVAPPIRIRLYPTASNAVKPDAAVMRTGKTVVATIGDVSFRQKGTLMRRPDDEVKVTCIAAGMPRNINLYIYILLVNEQGDLETEIDGALIMDKREWQFTGQFLARAEINNSQLYCLARWFDYTDNEYGDPIALRSPPVTLLIEPETLPEKSRVSDVYLWVAVGVGAVGWSIALSFIFLLIYLRIPSNIVQNSEQVPEEDKASRFGFGRLCGGYRFRRSDVTSGGGATVLPAHSLAADNIKLSHSHAPASTVTLARSHTPPVNTLSRSHAAPVNTLSRSHAPPAHVLLLHSPSAPPPEEGATYCNVKEMNTLLRRKQF